MIRRATATLYLMAAVAAFAQTPSYERQVADLSKPASVNQWNISLRQGMNGYVLPFDLVNGRSGTTNVPLSMSGWTAELAMRKPSGVDAARLPGTVSGSTASFTLTSAFLASPVKDWRLTLYLAKDGSIVNQAAGTISIEAAPDVDSGDLVLSRSINISQYTWLGQFPAANVPSASVAWGDVLSKPFTNISDIAHSDLDALDWTESGHTGTAGRVAYFGEGGAAGYAPAGAGITFANDDIAVSNSIIEGAALGATALQAETDPVFTNWLAATPPLYEYTETDPLWSAVSNTVTAGAALGATALQSGDNVSDLTNDAGYAIESDFFPYLQNAFSSGRLWGGEIVATNGMMIVVKAGAGLAKKETADLGGEGGIPTSLNQGAGSEWDVVSWGDTNLTLETGYNLIYWDASANGFAVSLQGNFYSEFDFIRDFTVGRVYADAEATTSRLCGMNLWNFPRRVQMFGEERFPVERATGLVIGATGRQYSVTDGVLWAELVNRFEVDGKELADNFRYWYLTDTTNWVSVQTNLINNTQYNIPATGLANFLNVNQWRADYVYAVHDGTHHVVMGQAQASSEANANLLAIPTPPPILGAYASLIGRITIKSAATSMTAASAFGTTFSAAAIPDHDGLSGLTGTGPEYVHLSAAERAAMVSTNDAAYTNTAALAAGAVQTTETRQVTIDAANAHTNTVGGLLTVLGRTVMAGENNTVGDYGFAVGSGNTVGLYGFAAGSGNTVGEQGVAVGGGNTVGDSAFGTGAGNTVGNHAFGAGAFGKGALGSFVFSDFDMDPFDRTAYANAFSVRASGGTYFETPTFEVTGNLSAGSYSATITPYPIAYSTNVTISATNGMEQRIESITGPMDITFPVGVTNLLTRFNLTIPPTGTNVVTMLPGPSYTFITPLVSTNWVGTNAYTHVWYVSEQGTTNSTAVVARGSVQ